MSELVTEGLNFLSQLPQVLHVVIKDIAHLEVKCSVWCKRLFEQHKYLPCCQKHISIKTSCGLNWQTWMLLCCSSPYVMGHLCTYVSGRQRFNVISPGSRGTVYAGNSSSEVLFLRRGMMIAVIINTGLCNLSWFLLIQAVMAVSKIPPEYLVISNVNSKCSTQKQFLLSAASHFVDFHDTPFFSAERRKRAPLCLFLQYHSSSVKCCKLYFCSFLQSFHLLVILWVRSKSYSHRKL